jgi:Tfp pilus assembly protein PilX
MKVMKSPHISRQERPEAGVALLLALVTMMLVAAIAMALLSGSGTESALAGNYRSSTGSYYAAFAGLEEGRGRLLPTNPNYFDNTVANFIPTSGTPPLALGQVRYILNAVPGETVAPTNQASTTTYPDTQYSSEFGSAPPTGGATQTVTSTTTVAGVQGPLYKWVRITPITEQAINKDVNNDSALNNTTALYYDGAHLNLTSTGKQAMEVTSLAVLPDGAQKMLQYLVAPVNYNLNFQSALSLVGPVGTFNGANSNPYYTNGNDGSGNPGTVAGCTANQPAVPAIGVSTAADDTYVTDNLPRPTHYVGAGGTPSVDTVTQTGPLQSPAELNQLVDTIKQNADAVVTPNPPTGTYNFGDPGWPSMSASDPKVVVVNGDFDLGPNTGYGLLIVTGNFHYHGNSGWKGIVLVIGDGTTTFDGLGGGNGEFDGAVLVATTKDSSGNTLDSYGSVNFDISGGGGNGIYYNSCWIQKAQGTPSFAILSFREVPQ